MTSFLWTLFILTRMFWAPESGASAAAAPSVFGVFGDAGVRTPDTDRVRRSLKKDEVTQLILAGDNLYDLDQSYDEVWGGWRNEGFTFPVVALGNHLRSYEEETRYFGLPGEFYSRRIPGARFIVLNSDNERNVPQQLDFLDRELEAAAGPGNGFVFLVFHHPTFSVSERHGWKEKEAFQLGVRAALRKHSSKITAVIVGHDHIASLLDVDGIPLIVSGATFEQLPSAPRAYVDSGFRVETKWLYRGGSHWMRLDVDPAKDQAWINFVRADTGDVSCSAKISARPMKLNDNCARTASLAPLVTAP